MNRLYFFALAILLTTSFIYSIDSNFGICTTDTNTCDLNLDVNTGLNFKFNYPQLSNPNGIPMYLFYSPACSHCKNVEEYLLTISKDYNLNVNAINRNGTKEELDFFTRVLNDFNSNNFGVPALVINGHIYYGDIAINENIIKELDYCKLNKCKLYAPNSGHEVVNYFTVFALAFADSVNPCALVVLLILLSTVLMKYGSKKKVLQYGLTFILTLYLMYFLIGVGIIFGFKLIGSYLETKIFYIILAIFALVLGLLNLKDYISYGAGGFLMEVPRSWRPLMNKVLSSVTSIWSAVVIAVILALFLLPCTAGPYVLISGLLYNYSWYAILGWLAIYNLVFSLPMWIILFIVYFGIFKIDVLQRTRDKNVRNLHLIAAICFLLLATYLFYLIFF